MSKMIVYTPAYNAEKTLVRTIESVLSQTYPDFVYYLLDNASSDNTHAIIKEYAQRDGRIVPLHNAINHGGNWITDVIQRHDDDSFLCELDADDEYKPEFLEKMLEFMNTNHLDIAACGSDFIDVQTGELSGIRRLNENMILKGKDYDDKFPGYYQFVRTIWGKIYSLPVLRDSFYKQYTLKGYGGDTFFALSAFYYSHRVGIFAESLHKYYVSNTTSSYRFDNRRVESDRILLDAGRKFLISKCGRVSAQNGEFLLMVYLNAIADTLRTLCNSELSDVEKLKKMLDVFQNDHFREVLSWTGDNDQKHILFGSVADWVLTRPDMQREDSIDRIADILAAMQYVPSSVPGWQDGWGFLLLIKIKDRLSMSMNTTSIDQSIIAAASKTKFLIQESLEFLISYRELAFLVLQEDEEQALRLLEEDIAAPGKDIPDLYIRSILTLGLNLSASLSQAEDFVFFKKLQISWLIDSLQFDEAATELADWADVLPEDPVFLELGNRLASFC